MAKKGFERRSDNVSVFNAMVWKHGKEQQTSFGNNVKYSDFIVISKKCSAFVVSGSKFVVFLAEGG